MNKSINEKIFVVRFWIMLMIQKWLVGSALDFVWVIAPVCSLLKHTNLFQISKQACEKSMWLFKKSESFYQVYMKTWKKLGCF